MTSEVGTASLPIIEEDHFVEVEGCPIHWRARGHREAGAVVLIHGGGANLHWWDAVIPGLRSDRRIVTVDLSGHGLSGKRPTYSASLWTKEIEVVLGRATAGTASLVGHSMGGRVAVAAAPALGRRVESLILVDVPIELGEAAARSGRRATGARVHRSVEDARLAFRLLPDQPVARPDVLAAIVENSIGEVPGGWSVRADPRVFFRIPDRVVIECLGKVECPVGLIRAGKGEYLNPGAVAQIEGLLEAPVTLLEVPHAHHHVMLDDPEALAEAIETLLSYKEYTS